MTAPGKRAWNCISRPVTSLANLADEVDSWRPDAYTSEQWGCEVHFKFPMVKLLDYNDKIDSLLEQTNPFAIITAAHLKTKATKNNPQERYTWKWTITRAKKQKTRKDRSKAKRRPGRPSTPQSVVDIILATSSTTGEGTYFAQQPRTTPLPSGGATDPRGFSV